MSNTFKSLLFTDDLPTPTVVDATGGGIFEFNIITTKATLHSTLTPNDENCWAVVQTNTVLPSGALPSYLGPLIVARKGRAVKIHWINKTSANKQSRPPISIINEVYTMDSSRWEAPNGLSMHLHGGKLLAKSDGWPLNTIKPQGMQICSYPNDQPSNLIWYHDHAMDWTARNVHAGIAGGYLIRDTFDDELMKIIPHNTNEIPLVFQDRQLWDPDKNQLTAKMRYEIDTGSSPTRNASYGISSSNIAGKVDVLPEFIGEFNLVNGRLWPKKYLAARDLYRLRMINGCNARTYAFRLLAKVNGTWTFLNDLFCVIGMDGGLLGEPLHMNTDEALILAPGERRDVILDLRNLSVDVVNGKAQLYLINTASVPFSSDTDSSPILSPANVLNTASTIEDISFNIDSQSFPQIMRFDVDITTPRHGHSGFFSVELPVLMIKARSKNKEFHYRSLSGWQPKPNADFEKSRVFLIDNSPPEVMQVDGGMLGKHDVGMMYLREYQRETDISKVNLVLDWDSDTASIGNSIGNSIGYSIVTSDFEKALKLGAPQPDSYERWYVINYYPNKSLAPADVPTLPLDMHPFHIHLVNFYCAQRWKIGKTGDDKYVESIPPSIRDYEHLALRDTIRANGSEILELIVYFPPGYNRQAEPFPSRISRYPFHCHILEHEEMGMMRYFDYS